MQINPNSGFNTQEMIYTKRKLLEGETAIEQIESELTRLPQPYFQTQDITCDGATSLYNFVITGKDAFYFVGNIKAGTSNAKLTISLNFDNGNQKTITWNDVIQNNERAVSMFVQFESGVGYSFHVQNKAPGNSYTVTNSPAFLITESGKLESMTFSFADSVPNNSTLKLYER